MEQYPLPDQEYMVLIRCYTYNHEAYIEDALKGFVMQKTNFPFVAVVVDDASTDETADIIRKYESKYPNIIKGVYLKENHYRKKPKSIYIAPWREKCKYEALCEGDDYWIDPLKLQKQVDFMENHSEYSLCFTNSVIKYEKNTTKKHKDLYKNLKNKDYTGEEILSKWLIPTASVLYKIDYENYPKDKRFVFGDIILFLHLAQKGKIYCINEKMSVYRRNESSITSKKISYHTMIDHYKAILEHFGDKYQIIINKLIAQSYIYEFLANKLNDKSWTILIEVSKNNNIAKYFWRFMPAILYKSIKNKIINSIKS